MHAPTSPLLTRRNLVIGGGLVMAMAVAAAFGRRLLGKLDSWTELPSFAASPPPVLHDPVRDRAKLGIGRGKAPSDNLDAALTAHGGLERLVTGDEVVIVKVSAQWWNQGMTNVAAVKRLVERILALPGFRGEVIVFENTHFRLADGSGLSRAWTRPSERNVDVEGWTKLGDLIPHFQGKPVSFVGLVDAGLSALSGDDWWDPGHAHGVYGGDGRGPIPPGDARDGYHWDFESAFKLRRSLLGHRQVPLTWPRFTSPHSGLVIDLRDGVLERSAEGLHPTKRTLRFINMTTANEHGSTGMTACCKSAMGLVDMSAGRLGTDPRVAAYHSIHYFGTPAANWRMAGPLAYFARRVRTPDLYVTVAEYVGVAPPGFKADPRLEAAAAHRVRTVVVGTDAVAIDTWVARNLLMPVRGESFADHDLDNPDSKLAKFLRYYRHVYGSGALDEALIDVA